MNTHRIQTFGLVVVVLLAAGAAGAAAGRETLWLDGDWQIEESLSATEQPTQFTHTAPVPGLANLARPTFPEVDQFDSCEVIANRIRNKKLPELARVQTAGVSRQNRNYFWYRKEFRAPAARAAALLRINKAQFGTAVWLNGKFLGEYPGCFSASRFNLTEAIPWNVRNVLLVRVGAHPSVLPANFPAGTDFEKLKWTPGIWEGLFLARFEHYVASILRRPGLRPSPLGGGLGAQTAGRPAPEDALE